MSVGRENLHRFGYPAPILTLQVVRQITTPEGDQNLLFQEDLATNAVYRRESEG